MSSEIETLTTGLPTKAIVQHADGAPVASLSPTDATRFLFSGVAGQPDFWESRMGRGDSAPLHKHPWATFEFIIEGSITYLIDGEEFVAGAGDFVYTPPSAVHTFVVESPTARLVGFNHPAPKFAELQMGAVPLFKQPGGPDMPKLLELATASGIALMGPPLEPRTN
jgi:mannose-6-phosphate isomerase-like protein (cupin superfamily)